MSGDHSAQQHDAYMLLLQGIQVKLDKLSDGQTILIDRVSAIETSNKAILGNGKPGRLDKVEGIVADQVKYISFQKGALRVIGVVLAGVATVLGKIWWDVIRLIQMHQPH
jgi:hypothetical protein